MSVVFFLSISLVYLPDNEDCRRKTDDDADKCNNSFDGERHLEKRNDGLDGSLKRESVGRGGGNARGMQETVSLGWYGGGSRREQNALYLA